MWTVEVVLFNGERFKTAMVFQSDIGPTLTSLLQDEKITDSEHAVMEINIELIG